MSSKSLKYNVYKTIFRKFQYFNTKRGRKAEKTALGDWIASHSRKFVSSSSCSSNNSDT